jgi:hypothetical protein
MLILITDPSYQGTVPRTTGTMTNSNDTATGQTILVDSLER